MKTAAIILTVIAVFLIADSGSRSSEEARTITDGSEYIGAYQLFTYPDGRKVYRRCEDGYTTSILYYSVPKGAIVEDSDEARLLKLEAQVSRLESHRN